jgi:hypothetical protein
MRPHSRPAPPRTIADYPGVARAARAWGCSLMMGQPNADEKAALSRVPARHRITNGALAMRTRRLARPSIWRQPCSLHRLRRKRHSAHAVGSRARTEYDSTVARHCRRCGQASLCTKPSREALHGVSCRLAAIDSVTLSDWGGTS